MPSYSKNEVVLVRYPFSDLSSVKVRPAIVINAPHSSQDIIIVPLTSRTHSLLPGEFMLTNWKAVGLNVPSAVKRGLFTIQDSLVIKALGNLTKADAEQLETSLKLWLGL
jgi:mRNA interferase MazF